MPRPSQPLTSSAATASGAPVPSFHLAGEGLSRIGGPDLVAAGKHYERELEPFAPELRADLEAEQRELANEASDWLERYNRNLYSRVRGYWRLGVRLSFAYPWPVVAILGISQVIEGLSKTRLYGLVGTAARRLRYPSLARISDATEDVLRRTNRAIFHDSVPTVLYALRCAALRNEGRFELADALENGPLPPLMDDECRQLIKGLVSGLAIENDAQRFADLTRLTMRHFHREQAVFTHHMGIDQSASPAPAFGWLARLTRLRSVPAPRIVGPSGDRRLVTRPFVLPPGFDMRDHDARVEAFGAAFVESVTGSVDDYRVAVEHCWRHFFPDEPKPLIAL